MNYAQGWLGAIWKKGKVKGNKISLGSYNDKLAITYICSLGFVLKYRFYYYSNMMKPRDQKTIATEKIVTPSFLEEATCHSTQAHTGKREDQSGGRGSKRFSCYFYKNWRVRHGKQG